LNFSSLNDAGLNMTATPEMRDFALRLLTYEAGEGKAFEPMEAPTLRVYEKLRRRLSDFVGIAGFLSLATRALTLAKREAPSLGAARVTADGALQGLVEFEPPLDMDRERAGEYPSCEDGVILIARMLGLLRLFLGEALTLNLLRNAWPGEVFDDHSSANGRKA
jgi:hypothetical protein